MRTINEVLGNEEYSLFAIKGYINPVYWIEKVSGYTLSWFAKEWVNAMQKYGKVNLIAHRGSAKTEIMAVMYTLWLMWYNRGLEILITSHSRDFAWKIMERIKTHINDNEFLQKLRPDSREDTWNKEYMTTSTKCNVYTKAYKPTIAGLRTDYIIVDESSKCVDDEGYSIFHRVIEGTGHMRDAKELCMTTPEQPTDLCYELKNNKEWVTFEVPVLNEKGKSNWEEKYPMSKIEKIRRTSGERAFQQEYLLNSTAQAENPIYPSEDIVNCFDENSRFESKPLDREKGYRVLAADFAVAKGPRADFDAFTIVELLDNHIYLKHGERHKGYPKSAKVKRLTSLYKLHDCHQIILDPNGIGAAVLQDLRKEFLPVVEQSFHSIARGQLLIALKIAIEDAKLIIPRDPECPLTMTYTNILFNELIGFKEEKIQGGNTKYLSKSSHDDTAISLAMGVKACSSKRPFIDMIGI